MSLFDWFRPRRPAPSAELPPLLDEGNLTVRALERVFRQAFLKSEPIKNDHILVNTDIGLKVIVHLDDERKFLKYMAFLHLKSDAPDSAKLRLANTLNEKVIFARFAVPQADVLVADYFLPYEEGVTPYQVVNALRQFAAVVFGSVNTLDEDDLIGSDSEPGEGEGSDPNL